MRKLRRLQRRPADNSRAKTTPEPGPGERPPPQSIIMLPPMISRHFTQTQACSRGELKPGLTVLQISVHRIETFCLSAPTLATAQRREAKPFVVNKPCLTALKKNDRRARTSGGLLYVAPFFRHLVGREVQLTERCDIPSIDSIKLPLKSCAKLPRKSPPFYHLNPSLFRQNLYGFKLRLIRPQ